MLAEWSAECGAHDPVLVVPWHSEGTSAHPFVDLRTDPYAVDEIPEADEHQALLHALRSLNATRCAVFTAKCDAWELPPEEEAALRLDLFAEDVNEGFGFASYIDLVWKDRAVFLSRHQISARLDRLIRHAEKLDHPMAKVEWIMRPAFIDLDTPQEGFSVSLYVKGFGAAATEAYLNWANALGDVVLLMRGKEAAL